MKKTVLIIAILWGMTLGAFAQLGHRDGVTYAPIALPPHGSSLDQDASIAVNFTQTIALLGGEWNRISIAVEVDDPIEMLQALEGAMGDHGVMIESTDYITEYSSVYGWEGDLDSEGVNNEEMYLVLTDADVTVELSGAPADPADHEITIYPNQWNRIGFPYSEPVSVEEALEGFEAVDGDLIESPNGTIEYYESEGGWIGDFDEFTPGEGYLFQSASDDERTLVFSTGGSKSKPRSDKRPE